MLLYRRAMECHTAVGQSCVIARIEIDLSPKPQRSHERQTTNRNESIKRINFITKQSCLNQSWCPSRVVCVCVRTASKLGE